jgi:hypothetical protein
MIATQSELRSRWSRSVILVSVLFAALAVVTTSELLSQSFEALVYLVANCIVFLDGADFFLRLYFQRVAKVGALHTQSISIPLDLGRFTTYQKHVHVRPYALLVSVFDLGSDLDEFVEAMRPYRDRLWIIDDASTDATFIRLQQQGFCCIQGDRNRRKPAAIKQLLQEVPKHVETIVVLDPDVLTKDGAAAIWTR